MNREAMNPYADLAGKNAYRGTLHSHSVSAHARVSPSEAKRKFLRNGFHFIGLTDHDRRWPEVPWLADEWAQSEPGRFVVLRGYEAGGEGWHVNSIGYFPEPMPTRAGRGPFVREALAAGGFVFLNHPAADGVSARSVLEHDELRRIEGIEVYSGLRASPAGGTDWRRGFSEQVWDELLAAGLRIWSLANPDCHTWDESQPDGPFNGYNVVFAESLTKTAIVSALKAGRFYATTGVEVDYVEANPRRISVACSAACEIRFIGSRGRLLATTAGPEATYEVRGEEAYVRAEVVAREPIFPGFTEPRHKAWLQPLWP